MTEQVIDYPSISVAVMSTRVETDVYVALIVKA